jgi:hypothetical protein
MLACMQSQSDFWLTVHHLANDLEREGATHEERMRVLLAHLAECAAATQALYREDVAFLLKGLNSLTVNFEDAEGDGRVNDEPSSPAYGQRAKKKPLWSSHSGRARAGAACDPAARTGKVYPDA